MVVENQDQLVGRHFRRSRRATDLPVRRWLQMCAGSAVVGAGLLCFSLMGPSTGVAAADSTTESAASTDADTANADSGTDDAPAAATEADDSDEEPANRDEDVDPQDPAGNEDLESADDSDDVDETPADGDGDSTAADDEAALALTATAGQTKDRAPKRDTLVTTEVEMDEPAAPVPAPPSLLPRPSWDDVVADVIDRWSAGTLAWIDSLPADDDEKVQLQATMLAVRRTFFNQAPTVDPVQITGLIAGDITGDINGKDAEDDELVYRLISGPRHGSVALNDDGTYTYTPSAGFDGVDSFRVVAIDVGLHVNLLNPFRGIGTGAFNLINQNAITFDFSYTGADWTPERQQALEEVAASLQECFRVHRPVTLTYDVNLEDPEDEERGLASATSPYISGLPGYWPTVIQHKLLTGLDANGAKADGEISWNFADEQWALGDLVSDQEIDFVSTAIHELMHSFGFLTSLHAPGENRGANRGSYDRNIVTVRGTRAFWFAGWPTLNDPKLTGQNGGLFFGGRNAVEAYGGLVPIFTPAVWDPGSSVHHLDDATFVGDDRKIMNAYTPPGAGPRVFSAVEIGILKDLGYTVVMPESPPYAAALIGVVFLMRRRRTERLVALSR
jgi:Bacterial Ig domain